MVRNPLFVRPIYRRLPRVRFFFPKAFLSDVMGCSCLFLPPSLSVPILNPLPSLFFSMLFSPFFLNAASELDILSPLHAPPLDVPPQRRSPSLKIPRPQVIVAPLCGFLDIWSELSFLLSLESLFFAWAFPLAAKSKLSGLFPIFTIFYFETDSFSLRHACAQDFLPEIL